MNNKIVSRARLSEILKRIPQGARVVFTNGCYDLLHVGHIRLLKKAKSCGELLVVALNSDSSVRRIKGKNRPWVNQNNRAEIIAALECVDYVTFFDEDTPLNIIRELKPDILIKGGDYKLQEIVGRGEVKKVLKFPFVPGFSTTRLLRKIARAYGKK